MAITHTVELVYGADATVCDVWDEYELTSSLLHAGAAFSFTLWHSVTRQSAWGVLTSTTSGILAGSPVSVRIDGETVLSGLVKTRYVGADANRAYLTISGHDLAGAAIEADANPRLSFKGMALGDALTRLFAGAGLPPVVISETINAIPGALTVRSLRTPHRSRTGKTSRTARLDLAHPRVGEKVWQVAERLCARMGYLLWVAPTMDGTTALVVDVPNYGGPRLWRFVRSLSDPSTNILNGGERTSLHDVPTAVTDYGAALRGNSASARLSTTLANAAVTDAAIHKGRILQPPPPSPRYLKSDHARSVQDATGEASRLLARANAHLRGCEYTVQGHATSAGGVLFRPNAMATVDDEVAQVREDMLVTDVTYHRTAQGSTTSKVVLSPLGAIRLIPITR